MYKRKSDLCPKCGEIIYITSYSMVEDKTYIKIACCKCDYSALYVRALNTDRRRPVAGGEVEQGEKSPKPGQ